MLHTATDHAVTNSNNKTLQVSLALASMARDDLPASSTVPASCMAAATARRPMRSKVGSEFET